MRGRSAGHGVHRTNSPMNLVGAGFKPAQTLPPQAPAAPLVAPSPASDSIRVHRRSPAFAKPASAGEGRSAVQTSLSAGHGVDRSFSNPTVAPAVIERTGLKPAFTPFGRRAQLHSSAALSAGHGLHPPFFDRRPALR
jgi:hypothetical protein